MTTMILIASGPRQEVDCSQVSDAIVGATVASSDTVIIHPGKPGTDETVDSVGHELGHTVVQIPYTEASAHNVIKTARGLEVAYGAALMAVVFWDGECEEVGALIKVCAQCGVDVELISTPQNRTGAK